MKPHPIFEQVRISDVYAALTGRKLRRTGVDTWRGQAWWRNGNGLNVRLDDSRGVWKDFVTNEGGGVLALVVRIRGGTRQDALRWVADFAGVPRRHASDIPRALRPAVGP